MKLPDIDPLDERYRWCIYCGADCWPDREFQEHAEDCPVTTGKYPLSHPSDPPDAPAPAFCSRCEKPLTSHYRHVQIAENVYEVVCDDCALMDFTTEKESA